MQLHCVHVYKYMYTHDCFSMNICFHIFWRDPSLAFQLQVIKIDEKELEPEDKAKDCLSFPWSQLVMTYLLLSSFPVYLVDDRETSIISVAQSRL